MTLAQFDVILQQAAKSTGGHQWKKSLVGSGTSVEIGIHAKIESPRSSGLAFFG
jgi:hypothetical protein